MIVCLYHNDLDGKCAGHLVYDFVDISTEEGLKMIPVNYNSVIPYDVLDENDTLYIVDFSIPPSTMEQLLENNVNVIWIDHHISAIEKYKDFPYDIRGIRYNGWAGCELTWAYLNGHPINEDVRGIIPNYIRLIGDYDTWQFRFEEDTVSLCSGIDSYNNNPDDYIWQNLKTIDGFFAVLERGGAIEEFKKKQRKEIVKEYAFISEFEGYKVAFCNANRQNSKLFDSFKGKYDFVSVFSYLPEGKWTFSIYQANDNSPDLSRIADKYGGGGHKGAAGFTVDTWRIENGKMMIE